MRQSRTGLPNVVSNVSHDEWGEGRPIINRLNQRFTTKPRSSAAVMGLTWNKPCCSPSGVP